MSETSIRQGYDAFKNAKHRMELTKLAAEQGLDPEALQDFLDGILERMVFDGEDLTRLLAPWTWAGRPEPRRNWL